MHAAHGFYNSGFKKALCIIRDGLGSDYPISHFQFQEGTFGSERNASFVASYPNNFEEIDKEVMVGFECDVDIGTARVSHHFSEGLAFQKTCVAMGMNEMDAGKLMGMSTYGKPNDSIPSMYINDQLNPNLFKWRNENLREGYLDYEFTDFQSKADFAYALQTATQNHVKRYIHSMVDKTGIKNVVLAGGYFLNCVANYEYLRDDIEFYIEPVSSDAGTSMGAAKYLHHTLTKDKTLNDKLKYSYDDYRIVDIEKVEEFIDDIDEVELLHTSDIYPEIEIVTEEMKDKIYTIQEKKESLLNELISSQLNKFLNLPMLNKTNRQMSFPSINLCISAFLLYDEDIDLYALALISLADLHR